MVLKSNKSKSNSLAAWIWAAIFAFPAVAIITGLFYYWFALADRYNVFLYYHDMGPLVPDTAPFSSVTASRYWIAGLVAAGLVMLVFSAANLILGRLANSYRCPDWWRVWVLSGVPLVALVPLIVMTVNQPTMPLTYAVRIIVATLLALVLAFIPGRVAAEQPLEWLFLAIDGFGLMFIMLNIIGLERLPGWIERGAIAFVVLIGLALFMGIAILGLATAVRAWLRMPGMGPGTIFLAGFCVSYLLIPVIHHLGFTDGYFYISDSDNFFARTIWLQLLAWLLAAGTAFVIYRLRYHIIDRRSQPVQV